MERIIVRLVFLVAVFACSDESSTSGQTSGTNTELNEQNAGSDVQTGSDMFASRAPDAMLLDPEPLGGSSGEMVPDRASLPAICIDPPPVNLGSPNLEQNCRSGNERKKIQDFRNPACRDFVNLGPRDPTLVFSENSANIELEDVVVTGVFDKDFAVQDPEGGEYSGLWIYNRDEPFPFPIEPGMRLRLSGQLLKYHGLTELKLDRDANAIELLESGGPIPAPIVINDPTLIADGGPFVDELESLLVQVPNQFIVSTTPDCPEETFMFVLNGGLRIDHADGITYEPKRGDFVESATGILHYKRAHHKILPRSNQDLVVTACGGVPDKCETIECPFDVGAQETGSVVITEIQNSPRGLDVQREYVELHNATSETIDLTGWRLQHCTEERIALSGRIAPGAYLVIAGDLSRDENGGVQADLSLQELGLPNGSGDLLLVNAEGLLVDQVRYSDEAPWPQREDGESLEVMTLSGDNSNGAVWRPGQREYGDGGWGSTGQPNL